MHDVRARMAGLHHLLTGGMSPPGTHYTYPPRRLWGDLGLTARDARPPRRSRPARLLRW